MSKLSDIVDVLEKQLDKMFSKITHLEHKNEVLTEKLTIAESKISKQQAEMEALKMKYDALKSASSFLGSDENKRETKLKINSLIREIDYCIAQLSS
jgi:chromosome segregation ATPase